MSILGDILIILGFIILEYGLYLYNLKISLVVGGCLLLITGLVISRNGAIRKDISTS